VVTSCAVHQHVLHTVHVNYDASTRYMGPAFGGVGGHETILMPLVQEGVGPETTGIQLFNSFAALRRSNWIAVRDFPFGSLQGSFDLAPHRGQATLFNCFVVSGVVRAEGS
jgi:hypothetical protein